MFTNLDNSGRVNKRASRLFYGAQSPDNFIGPVLRGSLLQSGVTFEKSIRDVYESLAKDFDEPED